MSFVPPLFLPVAQLLQPVWCCRFKAVVLLSPISSASVAWERELLWTPPTLFCCGMRKLPEMLEKRLAGQETYFLCCTGVCSSASPCLEQLPFFWWRTRFAALFPWLWLIWCPVWRSGADFAWQLVYVVSHNLVVLRNHKCSKWALSGACGFNKCSKGSDFSGTELATMDYMPHGAWRSLGSLCPTVSGHQNSCSPPV